MDYAFPTYTKFEFCITGPCFKGKTILFDYSSGDPLLHPAERAARRFQMPRLSAGHGGEARQGLRRRQRAREADGSICYNSGYPSSRLPCFHIPL